MFKTKFNTFSGFVHEYYNTNAYAAGWEHVIKSHERDEEKAFNKFYELFEILIKRQN